MQIYTKMYDILRDRARATTIKTLSIGLGYTAVELEDGSMGVGYTWLDSKTSCTLMKDPEDYEGKKSFFLLEKLFSENLLDRSVAIAAANALNYKYAATLEDDRDTLLDDLQIREGSRVSMVGFFSPVVEKLKTRRVELNVYDLGKQIGTEEEFYANLRHNTDAVILTSTSVIHGSTEEVLANVVPGTPCVLLGPTTPMMPAAFDHLPITILGGTLPVNFPSVLKSIRHAKGTHDIQLSSRKVYWKKG
jgi:hypothetical protein